MTVRENLELGSYLPAAKARRARVARRGAARCSRRWRRSSTQPGRRAVRRPAADGGDRARADGAAAAAAARRAVARPLAADRARHVRRRSAASTPRAWRCCWSSRTSRWRCERRDARLRARGRPHRRRRHAGRAAAPGPRSGAPTWACDTPFRRRSTMLFPTTIVGSFPQPEWLIDRAKLAGRFPPRVRAKELWRIPEPYLARGAGRRDPARDPRAGGGRASTSSPTARSGARATRTASPPRSTASTSTTPARALDRSGHPNPVPRIVGRIRRKHAVEVEDLKFLRAHTTRHGEDHRAGPVHDAAAGAERLLRERGRGGDGLRRRRQRGDQGPVRRRRRRRADRRALHAGAAREGAPVRAEGAQPRARRRHRHDRRAHLLRLRGDHPRAAERLLVPARAGAVQLPAGLDRDGAVEARLLGAAASSRASRSWSAASTSPTWRSRRRRRSSQRIERALPYVQARERDPRARLRHEVPAARDAPSAS